MGSSMNDLAFRINHTYEFKMMFGTYESADTDECYDCPVEDDD